MSETEWATILLAMLATANRPSLPTLLGCSSNSARCTPNEAYGLALKSIGELGFGFAAGREAASRNVPMLPHFSLFDFSGDPLGLGEGVGVAGLGDTVGAAGVAAGAVAGVAGLV